MDVLNVNIEKDENLLDNQYLTFAVANEDYGIEIALVTDIIAMQDITEIPRVPPHIKGVVNLRGKVVPVMDVRIKFCQEPLPYDERTCIIFVDMNDMLIGLIVDMVQEVVVIDTENIVPPPDAGGVRNKYIRGIGKTPNGIKLLIDCAELFNEGGLLFDPDII